MSRFISWLAVGVAAAFLVVASAAFGPGGYGVAGVRDQHRHARCIRRDRLQVPRRRAVASARPRDLRGQRVDDRRQPRILGGDRAIPGARQLACDQRPSRCRAYGTRDRTRLHRVPGPAPGHIVRAEASARDRGVASGARDAGRSAIASDVASHLTGRHLFIERLVGIAT